MPRLHRRLPPLVVAPIRMPHRSLDELFQVDVIETRKLDGHVVAADLLHVAAFEGADAASLAEEMLALPAAEAVFAERALARQEPESIGLDDGIPVARLRADRAVALVGALREIDVGFEFDGAAVAAAPVGFQHDTFLKA